MTGFAEGKPISWAVGSLDGPSTGLGDAAGSRLPLPTPSPGKLLGGGGGAGACAPLCDFCERPADRHCYIVRSPHSQHDHKSGSEVFGLHSHGVQVCVPLNSYAEAHNPQSDGTRRWGLEEVIIRSPERMGLGSPESPPAPPPSEATMKRWPSINQETGSHQNQPYWYPVPASRTVRTMFPWLKDPPPQRSL